MNISKLTTLLSSPFIKKARQHGMTLIEIIIVVALLGTLATVLITNFLGQQKQAQVGQVKIAMNNLQQALTLYKINMGQYPTTSQGIQALLKNPGSSARWRGPYVKKEQLTDVFGVEYNYKSDGRKFTVTSAGPSGEFGTPDDIIFPEPDSD